MDIKMKLLALYMLGAASLCSYRADAATTITLNPSGCFNTRICVNVANDAGLDISIYEPTNYPNVNVIIDGLIYYSPYNGPDLLLTASDGSTIVLNVAFSSHQNCVRSGRGQHCYVGWSILSGTIQR